MSGTKTLTITRTFDAPREKVWKAWTTPEHVKQWWGPQGFSAPEATIDFREGGTYLYCMRGGPDMGPFANKDFWSTGTYKEIVPMERIVATDNFADAHGNVISPNDAGMPGEWPEEMTVTVTFADAGEGKTKITLVHTGHPAEMAKDAEAGWNQSLDKFAAALADVR